MLLYLVVYHVATKPQRVKIDQIYTTVLRELQKLHFNATSLVVWWSELLTTNHEVPGSIPGSTMDIFPCRGR